jgi:hypothetical protein
LQIALKYKIYQLHEGQEQKSTAKVKCSTGSHFVTEWNLVNSNIVAHCFRKARFGITSHNMNVEDDITDEDWQGVSENQAITF